MSQRAPIEFSEPLQFMIPVDLKIWLRDYAAEYDLSMAAVIRFALNQLRKSEETVGAD